MFFGDQLLLLVLFHHLAVTCFAGPCLGFMVDEDELVALEYSTVTLNFTLSNTCSNKSGVDFVTVVDGSTTLCVVPHENGSCIPNSSYDPKCMCNATTQQYSVRSFITGKQSRRWTLVAEPTNVKKTVNITVEYPPEISKLTFESNGKEINKTAIAMPNSTMNILCLWKEGNPPQSVTLKKDGVELTSNESVQQNNLSLTEHVIHNVQCSDTGMISCEAPGARENKTQILHVKCEPLIAEGEFSFPASSGQQILEFPVTAYHHHVVTCQLWRYKATDNVPSSLPVDCTSTASLTGSVPNLTLTIELSEGTSQMNGRWRLDLRNSDENGSVYFTIENNSPEPSRVLIGAVIISIVIVGVVIVVIVVWRQRLIHKGKILRLPPPPAPHTFRRRAPDAVMFHVQPAGQDHRDSFISVHDHIYSEIPDDSETSDESVHSNASSPLSEGSMSDDFLRIIACPSSNSSLWDDDPDRPNVRSSSSVTTTATVHPAPKTDGTAAMTIADSWDEPPLDRNASMLPTSESILGEDVSHPRALCADELKTATTGSGEEEAAVALAETLYENNVTASIPPCHTSNEDYLQPIVSAPMSHNSLPDGYLHPIASVLEGARPATQARSDRPSQGRTASVRTASDVQPQAGKAVAKLQPHTNPPDDNLHPVSSALGKKTTAATVQPKQLSVGDDVVEPPYENMMDMSPPLSHSTLHVDYIIL